MTEYRDARHGLTMTVLKPADGSDFTCNGISSKAHDLTLVGVVDRRSNAGSRLVEPLPGRARLWEPTDDRPAVALELRRLGHDVLSIVPVERADDPQHAYQRVDTWTSMGGNFAHTSDGRFNDLVEQLTGERFYGAIAVHDRIEF